MQENSAIPNPGAGGSAKVKFGVLDTNVPTSHNLTVGQIRENYQSTWSMAPDVEPRVNGQKVEDNHVLQNGEMLEFHRKSGDKG
jgi:hypothetical protein